MSVNNILTALADTVRSVEGSTDQIVGLENLVGRAMAIIKSSGTGGAAPLVDEAVVVPQPTDTHFPAYENPKLLGDIVTGSRYVVLFLPANVPTIKQNTTQGVIAAKNYFEYDFSYMVGANGGISQFDRGVDLAIIFKGAVQIGPIATSLPIAPGTYRLVVFV